MRDCYLKVQTKNLTARAHVFAVHNRPVCSCALRLRYFRRIPQL